MLIQRAIIASHERRDNQLIPSISIIRLNDHHHVTNPNLRQEELYNMSNIIMHMFNRGPEMGIQQLNLENPIGLYADRSNYQTIVGLMAQFNAFNDARNTIRNILAFTVNITEYYDGTIKVTEVEYNLLCDIFPP